MPAATPDGTESTPWVGEMIGSPVEYAVAFNVKAAEYGRMSAFMLSAGG